MLHASYGADHTAPGQVKTGQRTGTWAGQKEGWSDETALGLRATPVLSIRLAQTDPLRILCHLFPSKLCRLAGRMGLPNGGQGSKVCNMYRVKKKEKKLLALGLPTADSIQGPAGLESADQLAPSKLGHLLVCSRPWPDTVGRQVPPRTHARKSTSTPSLIEAQPAQTILIYTATAT